MIFTAEQVDAAIEFVNAQIEAPDAGEPMMNEFVASQPLMLAYLMGADDEEFDEAELEYMLYLGVIIWRIYAQHRPSTPQITEEILEKMEDANADLFSENDDDEVGLMNLLENAASQYPQPELLNFVAESILNDEDGTFSEDNQGEVFFILKTIIDCFEYASAKNN